MARKLRNLVATASPIRPFSKWASPHDQFVFSPDMPTLMQVAKDWGLSYATVAVRSSREKWTSQREQFWLRARAIAEQKMAEEAAAKIVAANERHMKLGGVMQGLAGQLTVRASKNIEKISPAEGARTAAQLAKAGVDIERRGLGLADQVIHIQQVKEITERFMIVISKYVTDPDVFQNIARDLASARDVEIETTNQNIGLQPQAGEPSDDLVEGDKQ